MQGNLEATVTIGLSPDQVTSIFILFAYQKFKGDWRTGGPETFESFSEALLWAAGKVLRVGDEERDMTAGEGSLFDTELRLKQEQLAAGLFNDYAGKASGTLEEARAAFIATVAPYLTWRGLNDPVVSELVAIRELLERMEARSREGVLGRTSDMALASVILKLAKSAGIE